jgi:hypothetical protein
MAIFIWVTLFNGAGTRYVVSQKALAGLSPARSNTFTDTLS